MSGWLHLDVYFEHMDEGPRWRGRWVTMVMTIGSLRDGAGSHVKVREVIVKRHAMRGLQYLKSSFLSQDDG